MNEPPNDNDIDALLAYLKLSQPDPRWAHSLTALVAERDALKQRVAELESHKSVSVRLLIEERDALRKRVAELESQPPAASDRDLREQMSAMMSWMTHVTDMIVIHGLNADHAKIELSRRIDRAIVAATNCAMRKGGGA